MVAGLRNGPRERGVWEVEIVRSEAEELAALMDPKVCEWYTSQGMPPERLLTEASTRSTRARSRRWRVMAEVAHETWG